MEDQPFAYLVNSMKADVYLKDTRAHLYRTGTGDIRPILSICFHPKKKLVMAYSLRFEPLDPQALNILLYASFASSHEVPYGGLPDIIMCDSMPAFTPALQETLKRLGIRVQQDFQAEPVARGAFERFFARLTCEFWDTYSDCVTSDTQTPNVRTMDLTLFEADHLLRSYLLTYNEAICGESDEASPIAWLPSRQGEPSQLRMLLGAALPRVLTHKGISYLKQTYWHERFTSLVPGTTVFLRPVPSFSASMPETIDVFVQAEWICSFPVQAPQ